MLGASIGGGGKDATIAARTENVTTNDPAPKIKGFHARIGQYLAIEILEQEQKTFFRPTLSRMNMMKKRFAMGPTAPYIP